MQKSKSLSIEDLLLRSVSVLSIMISMYLIYRNHYIFLFASFPMCFLDQISNLNPFTSTAISSSGNDSVFFGSRGRRRPMLVKIIAVMCFILQIIFIISIAVTQESILDELAAIGTEQITEGVVSMFLAPLAMKDEASALLRRVQRQSASWIADNEEESMETAQSEELRNKRVRHRSKFDHKVDMKRWQEDQISEASKAMGLEIGDVSNTNVINAKTRSLQRKALLTLKEDETSTIFKGQDNRRQQVQNNDYRAQNKSSILGSTDTSITIAAKDIIQTAVGALLPPSDHSEFRYRQREEVRERYAHLFEGLPENGFRSDLKNPCWEINPEAYIDIIPMVTEKKKPESVEESTLCLPYVYLLGQPKCGTSDLFERIRAHPEVHPPKRKEIRWFTRGEFTTSWMSREDIYSNGEYDKYPYEKRLGNGTSIRSFSRHFSGAIQAIKQNPLSSITIDGGPHTFWWPTQNSNGEIDDSDVPIPQLLREIQPNAKFVITLSNPTNRMYSDYYFLGDDLRPVSGPRRPRKEHDESSVDSEQTKGEEKSAVNFHARAKRQIDDFENCMVKQNVTNSENIKIFKGKKYAEWLRASQICAHDRKVFGVGGTGRLSIGLYSLYYLKWLEHFPPNQFLFVRLEDYDNDPKEYMNRIFRFLGLKEMNDDSISEQRRDWQEKVLETVHKNVNKQHKDEMLPETKEMIDKFYEPYNTLLADLVNPFFNWVSSLSSSQIKENRDSHSFDLGHDSHEHDETLSQSNELEIKNENTQVFGNLRGGTKIKEFTLTNAPLFIFPQDFNLNDQGLTFNKKLMTDKNDLGFNPIFQNGHVIDPKIWQKQLNIQKKLFLDLKSVDTSKEFKFSDLSLEEKERTMLMYSELDNFYTMADANVQVCMAAFALDTNALKYLLYDMGVPSYVLVNDFSLYEVKMAKQSDLNPLFLEQRTAYHCLASVSLMVDANPKSYIFSVLKGTKSWLDQYLPEKKEDKYAVASDIMLSLGPATKEVAKWLNKFSVNPFLLDKSGNTALHIAARGGLYDAVNMMAENHYKNAPSIEREIIVKEYLDLKNNDNRTAMHYAAIMGHVHVVALLVAHGASMDIEDHHGVTVRNLVAVPGPVSPEDSLQYLGIKQRPPKKIERLLHPENINNYEKKGSWKTGNGGWNEDRLETYETDMECDVDQYWAHEITSDMIFSEYMAQGRPILIRGLIDEWPVIDIYKREILSSIKAQNIDGESETNAEKHGNEADQNIYLGDMKVQVSEIPYANKFGGTARVDMTLKKYIDEMMNHTHHMSTVTGNSRPWYVFKGHPIPKLSEDPEKSLVLYEDMVTPAVIQGAFERLKSFDPVEKSIKESQTSKIPEEIGDKRKSNRFYHSSRAHFVNAQWALGDKGSGAPIHFHNSAWNALIYGAKKWIIYPPAHMIMSKEHILDFIENEVSTLEEKPRKEFNLPSKDVNKMITVKAPRARPSSCVQTAGDIMIIPENWSHGVLNIQQSVAVATEAKAAIWRIPASKCLQYIPNDYDNSKMIH